MIRQKIFDDISSKVNEVLSQGPAKDLEKNVRAMLQAGFSKLDLVTREEFDVQQEVLTRTREKLRQMELRIAELEKQLAPKTGDDTPAES
ncbi:MAG: accessory factor UbiK family protein [Chitinivorax sp.]